MKFPSISLLSSAIPNQKDTPSLYNFIFHVCSHAVQNLGNSKLDFSIYSVTLPVPKQIFNENYPVHPKTFGERLRKARIDAGLNIREFAAQIGVTEDTVINWEIRGRMPMKKAVREKLKTTLVEFIDMN